MDPFTGLPVKLITVPEEPQAKRLLSFTTYERKLLVKRGLTAMRAKIGIQFGIWLGIFAGAIALISAPYKDKDLQGSVIAGAALVCAAILVLLPWDGTRFGRSMKLNATAASAACKSIDLAPDPAAESRDPTTVDTAEATELLPKLPPDLPVDTELTVLSEPESKVLEPELARLSESAPVVIGSATVLSEPESKVLHPEPARLSEPEAFVGASAAAKPSQDSEPAPLEEQESAPASLVHHEVLPNDGPVVQQEQRLSETPGVAGTGTCGNNWMCPCSSGPA